MESLAQFIAPIVSLWVIHNAIFSSTALVNAMRETVISGRYDRGRISVKHRKQMRTDWRLCIAATILVCFMFGFIVGAVSWVATDYLIQWAGGALAFYSFACGVGFVICSWGDNKLMKSAIGSQASAERGAAAEVAG